MLKRTIMAASLLCCEFSLSFGQVNNPQEAARIAAEAFVAAPDVEVAKTRPTYWNSWVVTDLGFTNTKLENWAAGGYNTMTLKASGDAQANYSKNLLSWNNRLQAEYGFLYSSDKKGLIQQNNDRIYAQSMLSYKTGKNSKWSFTASFDFRSQFANGYKYNTPAEGQSWLSAATLKSGCLSPAYTNIALGIDWKPQSWLSVNIAPLTGGFTICTAEKLRKTYGMKLREEGLDPAVGANYNMGLFQFGAQIKADYKLSINKVVNYETQLVLFSNYLDKPQNLRINWDNQISWQMAKYFKVTFKTWLIYDPNVLIATDKKPEGVEMVQFKEYLAFNFTYTFRFRRKE